MSAVGFERRLSGTKNAAINDAAAHPNDTDHLDKFGSTAGPATPYFVSHHGRREAGTRGASSWPSDGSTRWPAP